MSAKKWLLVPVLFGLCSCVTQGGVLQLETGKLVLSPTGDMSMVMDSVPATTNASTDASRFCCTSQLSISIFHFDMEAADGRSLFLF